MLTKQSKIDQITADNFGNIMWREVTEILEDGVVISQKYHRSSMSPGADITNAPEQVKVIAQATWTPEAIQPFTAEVIAAVDAQAAARVALETETAALEAAKVANGAAKAAVPTPVVEPEVLVETPQVIDAVAEATL